LWNNTPSAAGALIGVAAKSSSAPLSSTRPQLVAKITLRDPASPAAGTIRTDTTISPGFRTSVRYSPPKPNAPTVPIQWRPSAKRTWTPSTT
jgi:hypothetical protein